MIRAPRDDEDEPEDRFRPANGMRARWKYAYDLVVSREPGDSITLLELAEALDWDDFDVNDDRQRATLFQIMWEAIRHLEDDGQRTVKTIDKFGWVVLTSAQTLALAEGRRNKAARAVDRTVRVLTSIQEDELDRQQRSSLDFLASNLLRAGALYRRRTARFLDLERQSKARKEVEGR